MTGKPALRLAAAVTLIAAIATAVLFREHLDLALVDRWTASAGPAGPLLFVLLYAAAAVLFLPGSLLTLAGGALFGPAWGTLWNLCGATLGATIAFLLARHLGADWVRNRLGGRLERLFTGVEKEGWRFVAFTRLVPLFPFNLLNYALGVTRIGLAPYVVATFVCMFPAAVAYTYLGHAGRAALAGDQGLIQTGLAALALLAMVAFLPRLVGRLRTGPWIGVDQLRQWLQGKTPPLILDVRTAQEFNGEQGHLQGATNLPVEELRDRLDELHPYLETPIAIVCRTDRRSAQAARILAAGGFGQAQVIRGGMTAWLENGWPVEGQAAVDPAAEES